MAVTEIELQLARVGACQATTCGNCGDSLRVTRTEIDGYHCETCDLFYCYKCWWRIEIAHEMRDQERIRHSRETAPRIGSQNMKALYAKARYLRHASRGTSGRTLYEIFTETI